MFHSSINDNASRNTPAYVFEIQQVFRRENLPVGTDYAMLAIADGLANGSSLRTNLRRVIEEIILREDGRINSSELLSLILAASAAPVDPVPGVQMERAMYETLGFIMEVRQAHESPPETERDAVIAPEKAGLLSWPKSKTPGGRLENDPVRAWSHTLLVVAFCGVLAASIGIGVSRRLMEASANRIDTPTRTNTPSQTNSENRPIASASLAGAKRNAGPHASHSSQVRKPATLDQSAPERKSPLPAEPSIVAAKVPSPPSEAPSHSASASRKPAAPSNPTRFVRTREAASGESSPEKSGASRVTAALVTPAASISRPNSIPPLRGLVRSGSAGIMAANLVWSPTPVYPSAATEAKVEGEVTVNALVGKDGNIVSATVVSGPPLLREAALKAVEQWQYRPYLISGRPTVVATTAIVDFELIHD